ALDKAGLHKSAIKIKIIFHNSDRIEIFKKIKKIFVDIFILNEILERNEQKQADSEPLHQFDEATRKITAAAERRCGRAHSRRGSARYRRD
ncbi:MAG: hypothetical protein IJI37_00645, partial [Opitutales bacterium]|nr:hypothetical protein [Opitutales bacterium]